MERSELWHQKVMLQNPPRITSTASIVGPKEGKGPLRLFFDNIIEDEMWGEKKKGNKTSQEIDYVISGDLLNQCIAANFGLRESDVPFFGACSTIAESMSIGAMLVDGGFADNVVCITSSPVLAPEECSPAKLLTWESKMQTIWEPPWHLRLLIQ